MGTGLNNFLGFQLKTGKNSKLLAQFSSFIQNTKPELIWNVNKGGPFQTQRDNFSVSV